MSKALLPQQGRKQGCWKVEHVQQAEGSMHVRSGEHTHPVTPHRPGSIAQNEGLQEESKPQALDLGKQQQKIAIRPPIKVW